MSFKLKKIGSVVEKTFGMKEILGLLGDKTNDEITIDDEKYKLSSLVELTASDGSVLPELNWIKLPLPVQQANQQTFSVSLPVSDVQGLFLVVNGLMYDYGTDAGFHLNETGTILYWHGGFNLSSADKIYVKHLIIAFPELPN